MKFKLALAQCKHPEDGNVLALVESWEARAAAAGADLIVFPESLMTRYEVSRGDFLASAEPIDGPFARGICKIAASHGLWTVFTMNEHNLDCTEGPDGAQASASKPPFNTAVICDARGNIRGAYRKTHLFDTDFTRESDRMSPGDALFKPLRSPFATIGLAICYDLRFPEVARHEALGGAELMLYPAAWVSGPGKRGQWQTLLRARAVENEIFVAGLSRCDEGYIGSSVVVAPDGKILAEGGADEELLVCDIDTDLIAKVRAKMPVFDHRRPELY